MFSAIIGLLFSGEPRLSYIVNNGQDTICQRNAGEEYPPCCTINILLALTAYQNEVVPGTASSSVCVFPDGSSYDAPAVFRQKSADQLVGFLSKALKKEWPVFLEASIREFQYPCNANFATNLEDTLFGSLKISPMQQVAFLEQQVANAEVMDIFHLADPRVPAGWKIYGKTGAAWQRDKDGKRLLLRHGWFVGYAIQSPTDKPMSSAAPIFFAYHVEDTQEKDDWTAPGEARELAITSVTDYIRSLPNDKH